MTKVKDFVADLAKAGKGLKEIKEMADTVYGDKSISSRQIYHLLKQVKAGENTDDRRRFNPQKTARTASLVAAVTTAVEADRRLCVRALAQALGTSRMTIHRILHDDLGLIKKSACWVPKLLSQEQKKERVRTSRQMVKLIREKGKGVLGQIVTMDESAVSFHTPETKKQSKQWLKKGTPGPIKARVHATREKQMVLAFFDKNGLIYTNTVHRGKTVTGSYMVEALRLFMRRMNQKQPELVKDEWFLHWDNAPVHKAKVVADFVRGRGLKLLEHPPYSPDLAPADYLLFPKIKDALAGRTMTRTTFKQAWDGVVAQLTKDDFSRAFKKWEHCWNKCIEIGGDYVEKS